MRSVKLFRAVGPYLTAAAVVVLSALLVVVVHVTALDLQWTAFLSGMLITAVLAMVSHSSHSQWALARRTAQLHVAKERLEREARLRQSAETAMAAGRARHQLIDEDLPSMVAYVDADERCQYSNAALRRALGVPNGSAEGRPMRELFGNELYGQLQDVMAEARSGRTVHRDLTLKMPAGGVYHVAAQLVPRFAADGSSLGFYALLIDITDRSDLKRHQQEPAVALPALHGGATPALDGNAMFVDCFAEEATGWHDAGDRIRSALAHDEFRLYCQTIVPLAPRGGMPVHQEIFVRLLEEETNLMPPGTFLPIAEKYGLLPDVDRWVLKHVLLAAAARPARAGGGPGTFFVNLAGATIADPDFAEYVRRQLAATRVDGRIICIELDVADVTPRRQEAARMLAKLGQLGCRSALSGFGRDRVSFDLIKSLKVDYLKIDGSLILNVLRDPVAMAKVIAINKVAHAHGIRTIAQHVEDRDTLAKLREIGVDFAQGFGVSRPQPLGDHPAMGVARRAAA